MKHIVLIFMNKMNSYNVFAVGYRIITVDGLYSFYDTNLIPLLSLRFENSQRLIGSLLTTEKHSINVTKSIFSIKKLMVIVSNFIIMISNF